MSIDFDTSPPANPLNPEWTIERIDHLKQLWADKLTCSMIAAKLGGVSRNAVIGKVRRLGLERRADTHPFRAPRKTNPAPNPNLRRKVPPKPPLRFMVPFHVKASEPISAQKTIIDTTGCRFATGTNDKGQHVFCNAPGMPWCAFHQSIVYSKGA